MSTSVFHEADHPRAYDGRFAQKPEAPESSERLVAPATIATDGAWPETVSGCPACGAAMLGHYRAGRFLPGSTCRECGHTTGAVFRIDATDPRTERGVYLLADGSLEVRESDGTVSGVYSVGTDDWYEHASYLGLDDDEDAITRAVIATRAPDEMLTDLCTRNGHPELVGVYQIVLDRGEIPVGYLVDQHATGRAMDSLASTDYQRAMHGLWDDHHVADAAYFPSDDATRQHLDRICDEAGLPAMRPIYEDLLSRGAVGRRFLNHTPDDVMTDYERHVGPAIDAFSRHVGYHYVCDRAQETEAELEAIARDIEDLRDPAGDPVSARRLQRDLEEAWDDFDNDGSHSSAIAYADRIEEISRTTLWRIAERESGYNNDADFGADERDRRLEAEYGDFEHRLAVVANRIRTAAATVESARR